MERLSSGEHQLDASPVLQASSPAWLLLQLCTLYLSPRQRGGNTLVPPPPHLSVSLFTPPHTTLPSCPDHACGTHRGVVASRGGSTHSRRVGCGVRRPLHERRHIGVVHKPSRCAGGGRSHPGRLQRSLCGLLAWYDGAQVNRGALAGVHVQPLWTSLCPEDLKETFRRSCDRRLQRAMLVRPGSPMLMGWILLDPAVPVLDRQQPQ